MGLQSIRISIKTYFENNILKMAASKKHTLNRNNRNDD